MRKRELAVTVAEQVFVRQAELAAALQGNAFSGEEYQAWRAQLVETMRSQVVALNDELFTVRSHRREVERVPLRGVVRAAVFCGSCRAEKSHFYARGERRI